MKKVFLHFSPFAFLVIFAMNLFGEEEAGGEKALASRLQERIDAFHDGAEPNGESLRLVYFHPGDTEPQAGYRERVRRIVEDIRDFYQAEMKKAGFKTRKLPLEKKGEDDLVIHLVKGSGKSDDYTYESGARVKREMQKALAGKIDFENDFVLVLGGMCQKRGENHYFFHAPYYGAPGSNQVWGLCYAADCEVLDPDNLSAARSKEKFKFEEHYSPYEMNLARFNSWYLGGIAHELGHGLSLPHNGQLPAEKKARGNALMGGGNHTYGDDRWGGGKGSFMTFATCLRLATHPLFTGSDRERFTDVAHRFEDLDFESSGSRLSIRGEITGSPDPLAVIAYSDPPGGAGYNALTWVAEVGKGGRFEIAANQHSPGPHELRLTAVHANGATSTMRSRYFVNEKGEPDAGALLARAITEPAESIYLAGDRKRAAEEARRLLESKPIAAADQRLRHLINLADPAEPVDLATVEKADRVFLSDAKWEGATVGWGKPARNEYFSGGGIRDAVFLEVGGRFFEKGLYAHAPSEYVFAIDGAWKTFTATVGLQGGVGPAGRSRFLVEGDGKVLFTSKLLKGMESQQVEVDVSGVNELRLVVESGITGNPQCWSVWGAPMLGR